MKKRLCGAFSLMLIFVMLFSNITAYAACGPSNMVTIDKSVLASGTRNTAVSPRAVQLKYNDNSGNNGKMYTTFECGQLNVKGMQNFPVYESLDNGQTWSSNPVGYIEDTHNNWGMCDCPQLYELPDALGDLPKGTLICIGDAVPMDLSKTSLDMYYSTDLGRTWTYKSTVAIGGKNIMGDDPVWEPFILYYNNKLICYYSDETDPKYAQKIVHRTSTDGIHWSDAVDDVAWEKESLRPGMPVVAQMQNGYFIMTYESVGFEGLPTNYKISKYPNDPEQWEAADPGKTYGYGGSPYVITLDDGTIVATAFGTQNVYVNTKKDASGDWMQYQCPLETGYNRQMIQLANGEVFILSCPLPDQKTSNTVKYASWDLKSEIGTNDLSNCYNISNKSDGKYLCTWGTSTTNEIPIVQWSKENGMQFQWKMEQLGNGNYKIINQYSNMVMTSVSGAAISIIQAHDTGAPNQQWKVENQVNGYSKIVSAENNKVLSQNVMSNDSYNVNDMAIFLEDTGVSDAQLWKLEPLFSSSDPTQYSITTDMGDKGSIYPQSTTVNAGSTQYFVVSLAQGYILKDVLVNGISIGSNRTFRLTNINENKNIQVVYDKLDDNALNIRSKVNDKAVCIGQASKAENAPTIEWTLQDGLEFDWVLKQEEGTEYYKIENVNSNKLLSVDGTSTASGAAIVQKNYVAGDLQSLWKVQRESNGYYKIVNANSGLALTRGEPDSQGDCYPIQDTYTGIDNQLWYLQYVNPRTEYQVSIADITNGTVKADFTKGVRGDKITLTVKPAEGYQLKPDSLKYNGIPIQSNSFLMPEGNVLVTAEFIRKSDIPVSPSNTSTPSNPGTSVTPPSPSVAPPKTPGFTPNPVAMETVVLEATMKKDGSALVTISEDSIKKAIDNALAQAKQQGGSLNGAGVVLQLDATNKVKSVAIEMSQSTLTALASSELQSVQLNGKLTALTFDKEALKEIQKQSAGNPIKIFIKPVKDLSANATKQIGKRPVYEVGISYEEDGKTKKITNLKQGEVIISIPYTPANGEKTKNLHACYVDAKGKLHIISDSKYNKNTESVVFTSKKSATYGVILKK